MLSTLLRSASVWERIMRVRFFGVVLPRFALLTLGCVGLLAISTASVRAATVNLSTGLDATDALITIGNTPDAHWTVDQPLGGTAPAEVVAAGNAGGAFGPWAANGPGSSWITIDADSVGNAPVVPYTYYRTFNLTAADLVTAAISGVWGIDDSGDLKLNGNTISTLVNDYSATTPFSVPAGSGFFALGTNTLTITMTSSDNFLEAVRLEGALNTVPTPAAFVGGGVMLGLLGVRRIIRRKA
jgi:hypothetical protein